MSHPPPIDPELPPSRRPTVIREGVFIPEPRRRTRLRALVAEALDLPPSQALAALVLGGVIGLAFVVLLAMAAVSAL